MTVEQANKIKKILKKENVVRNNAVYHIRNGNLRVCIVEFLDYSNFYEKYTALTKEEKELKTRKNTIKVLRALERNGLRPEYETEQRNHTNYFGRWDARYLIFE